MPGIVCMSNYLHLPGRSSAIVIPILVKGAEAQCIVACRRQPVVSTAEVKLNQKIPWLMLLATLPCQLLMKINDHILIENISGCLLECALLAIPHFTEILH